MSVLLASATACFLSRTSTFSFPFLAGTKKSFRLEVQAQGPLFHVLVKGAEPKFTFSQHSGKCSLGHISETLDYSPMNSVHPKDGRRWSLFLILGTHPVLLGLHTLLIYQSQL